MQSGAQPKGEPRAETGEELPDHVMCGRPNSASATMVDQLPAGSMVCIQNAGRQRQSEASRDGSQQCLHLSVISPLVLLAGARKV